MMIKTVSLYACIGFYIFAGLYHFINEAFYIALIPPYFPEKELINILAGLIEIALGIGLVFSKTRKWAAYGIIVMLIAFIPAHIYSIQLDGCIPNSICVPPFVVWARLVLIHPILMIWAYMHRK